MADTFETERTIDQVIADLQAKKLKEKEKEKKKEISAPVVEEKTIAEDLTSKFVSPVVDFASEIDYPDFVKNLTDETIRQLGLTVRSGGEGLASLGGIVYDPVALIVNTASKLATGGEGTNIPALSSQMSDLLNSLGIPEPESSVEEVVNMVGQGMTAGGGTAAIAKNLSNFLTRNSKKIADILAKGPGTQTVAGGTAGGAGQTVAEMGYGPVAQITASLAGGILGGKGTNVKTEPVSEQIIKTAKKAEESGIPILTSDVRPPSTFAGKWLQRTSESIPVLGTGGIRDAQNKLRIKAVRDLAEYFGVSLGDDTDVIENVTQDLLRKRSGDLTKYTSMKNSVIKNETLNKIGKVDVSKTVAVIDEEIKYLSQLRSKELAPIIDRLKDWKTSLLGQKTVTIDGKQVTINEGQNLQNIDLLRKQLGQSFQDPSLANLKQLGQQSLNKIYGPLRDDIGNFIKINGSKNDYKKWKVSNERLSGLAGDLDNSVFKNVLQKGEISPENMTRLLFSKKPSDLKLLFKSLDLQGRANARTAIIADMFKKSLNADQSISPDVFKNQIKKMGNQLGIFFSEGDLKAVEGLGKILVLTKRGAEANVLPPTGAMVNIPIISGFLVQSLGGVGGGAIAVGGIGGIARLLESPAVRNILVKLPKLSPGSPQEAEWLKRLDDIIILQTGGEQTEDYPQETSGVLDNIIQNISPSAINKVNQAVS
jgi:hypothetical protein